MNEKTQCPKCLTNSLLHAQDANTKSEVLWCMKCNKEIIPEDFNKVSDIKKPIGIVCNSKEKDLVRGFVYRKATRLKNAKILDFFGDGAMIERYKYLPYDYEIHTVDYSANAYEKMQQYKSDKIFIHNYSLLDFVNIFDKQFYFNIVWLDYCGYWNKKKLADLDGLLLKKLFAESGWLFVTVLAGREKQEIVNRELEIPIEIILRAKTYGYRLNLIYKAYYISNSAMLVFGFKIEYLSSHNSQFTFKTLCKKSLTEIDFIGDCKYKCCMMGDYEINKTFGKKHHHEHREEHLEESRQHRIKNAERLKMRDREYYKNHKEERREYSKKWSKEHREYCKEYQKKWRQDNKERTKLNSLLYRQLNKDKIKKNHHAYYQLHKQEGNVKARERLYRNKLNHKTLEQNTEQVI